MYITDGHFASTVKGVLRAFWMFWHNRLKVVSRVFCIVLQFPSFCVVMQSGLPIFRFVIFAFGFFYFFSLNKSPFCRLFLQNRNVWWHVCLSIKDFGCIKNCANCKWWKKRRRCCQNKPSINKYSQMTVEMNYKY